MNKNILHIKRDERVRGFCVFIIIVVHFFCLKAQYSNESVVIDSVFNYNQNNLDTIIIHDISFSANDSDIVLLYQAKGVDWNYSQEAPSSDYRYTGRFSFHIIHKRIDNKVIVNSIPREDGDTYNPKYKVQLVKVCKYTDIAKNKIITSKLTPEPWDGNKGGLIVIIADTLELKADIDASGCGFKGATPTNSDSVKCWASDTLNVGKKNLPYSRKDLAGLKGESVVLFDSAYMRGRSPNYHGGGGGNGYHSGGGGGGCYYSGGNGGYEAKKCDTVPIDLGGRGGMGLSSGVLNTINPPVAVFGGGGGCGTQLNGFSSTKGGNGGGIIIIMSNFLKGNGHSIKADGQSVTGIATGAAGGGGGAGTIILDVNNFLDKIRVSIKGGNGGSVSTAPPIPGSGGGGAGGFLRYNKSNINDSIVLLSDGGLYGNSSPFIDKNAGMGGYGLSVGDLVMPVKDFLFNLMPADQEICEGETPKLITASVPKGATNNFKYIWRKSVDRKNWEVIDTATRIHFQPPPLFDTIYIQRIVNAVDNLNNIVASDTGFILTINVLPKITNNNIYIDTNIVCSGVLMPIAHGSIPLGGNGIYEYTWEDSIKNSQYWVNATGVFNKQNYLPNYNDTVFLRRTVKSGVCRSVSSLIKINVLPKIQNNLVVDSQWVELGNIPMPLSGMTATGGDGSYTYIWQESKDKITWSNKSISTDNIIVNLSRPTSIDTTFYRRIIFSGLYSTCKDTSIITPVYVLDSLTNNIVTGNDTICSGTTPNDFIGTKPKGGDNIYRFKWEKSNDLINWDSVGYITDTIFNPGIVYDDSYYRRIAFSGNRNSCKDTSNIIFIKTIPAIENNQILHSKDTTICYGQTAGTLLASLPIKGEGTYAYQWEVDTSGIFVPLIANSNNISYETPNLYDTVRYRRKVESGICISYSDTIVIKVLQPITNNLISKDTTICKYQTPGILSGSLPEGGDADRMSYLWLYSNNQKDWFSCPDNNNSKDYISPIIDTTLYFKRIVFSGQNNCCRDTSKQIVVKVNELPMAVLNSFDDSICFGGDYVLKMNIVGQAPFIVKYSDENAIFDTVFTSTGNNNWKITPYRPGVFTISLQQVIDKNGCSPKEYKEVGKLSVFRIPVAIAGNDTSVCGSEVQLHANTDEGIGKWTCTTAVEYEGGENAPITKARSNHYGTQIFTWTIDNGGCISTSNIQVTFYEMPPNPLVGPTQAGPFLFITNLKAYLPVFGQGKWTTPDTTINIDNPNDPETKVSNLKFGKNYFQWYVTNGVCQAASDTLVVEVNDINVPEGFSPNGDNINDFFEIKGLENTEKAELIILNRWGKEVYHSHDYKNDWDGTYQSERLPEDTYYYVLKVIGRIYKGFVLLKR